MKFERIGKEFSKIRNDYRAAREFQLTAGPVDDPLFFAIRDDLDRRVKLLAQQFSSSVSFSMGGAPVPKGAPGLEASVHLETDIRILEVNVAMFAFYASAFTLENAIVEIDISSGVRKEQEKILSGIRAEIGGYYKQDKFTEFINRAAALRETLMKSSDAINVAVKKAIAIHILITVAATIVASLVTFGVAAIARAALVGETLAVLRTAQAVSTLTFLVEAGAFTAAQSRFQASLVRKRARSPVGLPQPE